MGVFKEENSSKAKNIISGSEAANYIMQSTNNDFIRKFDEITQSTIENIKKNFPSADVTVYNEGKGAFVDCGEVSIKSSEKDKQTLKEFIKNSYINICE